MAFFSRNPRSLLILLAALLLSFASRAAVPHEPGQDVSTQVMTLETGLGSDRVLLLSPPHPRAALVMLPGGTGRVGILANGRIRHGANFVVRTRAAWVRRGFAVLIPDSPGNRNLRGRRHGSAFAAFVSTFVAIAHRDTGASVFLVGTSQGTIATINSAAHARPGSLAGIVLTESVSLPGRLSRETVFNANPAAVRVPVLIVANRRDSCPVAAPSMAPRIAHALSSAPSVTLRLVDGGDLRSRRCSSLSPHGYLGIAPEIVSLITGWIGSHLPQPPVRPIQRNCPAFVRQQHMIRP